MLTIDLNTGRLADQQTGTVFAALPYRYAVKGNIGATPFRETNLVDRSVSVEGDTTVLTGQFPAAQLSLRQEVRAVAGGLDEIISLTNHGAEPVQLTDIGIGFAARLADHAGWQLTAVPFTVQLDGSRHDYSAADLVAGKFKNAACSDNSRVEPALVEANRIRSEAWAWRYGDINLVAMKYNPAEMELSVAAVLEEDGAKCLRFGGVGTCLYGEPVRLHAIAPGQTVSFGVTMYRVVRGDSTAGHAVYRAELDRRGHGLPADYNPPVNWNELYDIGWYHSDPDGLKKNYTRDALERQAALARDVGCDLLYLDPGWEVAEGLTRWDEARLGKQSEFAARLREQYGLGLGIRCILRCNGDTSHHEWDERFVVGHPYKRVLWHNYNPTAGHKEYCLCAPEFRRQKLERIDALMKGGATFLMVDEMDWRGPCHDKNHGHAVPSTHDEHVRAVYTLCRELRERNPGLLIECHDPLWPWHTCIYVPTYFAQGFKGGAYQENWGFEYMWNCLTDLKSGKAMSLYYYALGCNIPLYLHITMAADNDACIFFWWAASTVRHLGIGGKQGHPSVNPAHPLPPHDPEKRFAAYKQQMKRYRALKPWFVRGTFHGLGETAHLHTLPDKPGGVLNLFNLTDDPKDMEVRIPRSLLKADEPLSVDQGQAEWSANAVTIRLSLPAMSPAVITIGIQQ